MTNDLDLAEMHRSVAVTKYNEGNTGDAIQQILCALNHLIDHVRPRHTGTSCVAPAPPRSPSEENGGECPTCKGRGGFMSTARGKGGQMSTECLDCGDTGRVENAGEGASDEELRRTFMQAGQGPDDTFVVVRGERAIYDLGKKHQASADARALDEAEARGRPQWRSASEPPDTSRDVLVVTPDDMGKPCQWVAHHEGGWCCVGEFDPTHWMELPPLPEPPTQATAED